MTPFGLEYYTNAIDGARVEYNGNGRLTKASTGLERHQSTWNRMGNSPSRQTL